MRRIVLFISVVLWVTSCKKPTDNRVFDTTAPDIEIVSPPAPKDTFINGNLVKYPYSALIGGDFNLKVNVADNTSLDSVLVSIYPDSLENQPLFNKTYYVFSKEFKLDSTFIILPIEISRVHYVKVSAHDLRANNSIAGRPFRFIGEDE